MVRAARLGLAQPLAVPLRVKHALGAARNPAHSVLARAVALTPRKTLAVQLWVLPAPRDEHLTAAAAAPCSRFAASFACRA